MYEKFLMYFCFVGIALVSPVWLFLLLTRLSTFASTANFFRGVTPRDGVVCRESSRIASRNAVS